MKAELSDVLLMLEKWKNENTPVMFLTKIDNVAVGVFGAILSANDSRIVIQSGIHAYAIVGLPRCSFEFLDAEQAGKMFIETNNHEQFGEVSIKVTHTSGAIAVFAGVKLRKA